MVDISNINFFLTMTTTSEEDANTAAEAHRLGLHALNAGNFKVSLSFFRKALKVNPKIIEYWASYIEALVGLERVSDAKSILQKVRDRGAKISALDRLEQYIALLPVDPPAEKMQALIDVYNQGSYQQVIGQAKTLLRKFPNAAELHNIQGAAYASLGQLDAAIDSYKYTIEIKPDFAEVYSNMGNALQKKGDFDSAIDCYQQAVMKNPDYAEAYSNMGSALEKKGALNAAINSYKHAVKIQPDFAEAYSNMGNALQRNGELNAAIDSYKRAIRIKPNFVEAYNNMGNVLQDTGDLDAAIVSYKQAIKIKPDYAEAAFNLSGSSNGIFEAKYWLEQCLAADNSHLMAKLNLAALRYYTGDVYNFNDLMKSSLKDHPAMRSYAWVFNLPELPELYFHRWALFDRIVEQTKKSRPFYEFGVWRGEAFHYLIKNYEKGYGFDTFDGLPENWHEERKGSYSSDGQVPTIDGGEFIVGQFEDTLPKFFSKSRPVASLINYDADLYSSTICALNFTKPVIDRHTILIFDEFLINRNWEQDEYKALNQFCLNHNCTYEVLAVSFFTKQVAVRLLGI